MGSSTRNMLGPLGGAGREQREGWALRPRIPAGLLLEMLLLTHPLGFSYVTGSGGHTRAARISSKYHSGPPPSVLWGCVHSVPSPWNATLVLHDQALVPPCYVTCPRWPPHGGILSSSETLRLYFQLCHDSFLP